MISRARVRRVRIGAQGAAAAMALALGVVIVIGAPSSGAGDREPVAIEPVLAGGAGDAQSPSGPAPDQSRVDFEGIAERLRQMKNAPIPVPVVIDTPDSDGEGPVETQASGEIKYLGMITVGLRRSALLNIDGVQRIVAQGGTLVRSGGELRVFSVQADYVVLSEGRERQRIEKTARGSSSVTRIDPSSVAPSPTVTSTRPGQSAVSAAADRGGREAPREDFEQRRFEAIQKALSEGRIDQDDANRMLERIQRMREEREREGDR